MYRWFIGIIVCLLAAQSARADAEYADPSWATLMQTMVRFGAVDLDDPTLMDEYAIITQCDLYKAFYHDDFKWNQVRKAVKQSVSGHIAEFPMKYHFDIRLQLERYDFKGHTFKLTEKTSLQNVNTIVMFDVIGTSCGAADVSFVPRTYRAVFAAPLYITSLPIAEKDAQVMLKRMDDAGNKERFIYARFNMRAVYIEPLRKSTTKVGQDLIVKYMQSNMPKVQSARIDMRLDSLDFYDDPAMKNLVYEFQP